MINMYVIKNNGKTISGITEDGVLQYVYGDRRPKVFESESEAKAWWDEHVSTLPRLGEGQIALEQCAPENSAGDEESQTA